MAGKMQRRNAVAVGELTGAILDPVLRKRAGFSTALLQSWPEIVGRRLSASARPLKLQWPRRAHEDDPFRPATLVVACEGVAALHLQHETTEIIAKVNATLGFAAVDRVRIVQKPAAIEPLPPRRQPRRLTASESADIDGKVVGVENQNLRDALRRLGASVAGSRKP